MATKKVPIVAIVGRANVGKSSLFNAVLHRREAIVANEPGTTRDSVIAKASVWVSEPAGLGAVQGSNEQRASRTKTYGARAAQAADAIMLQEPAGATSSARRHSRAASGYQQDFWLVDTAGMKDPEDDFEFTIQEQITQAADSADVIWVVIEADTVITEEDRRVAKLALKSRKPVFLIVNKIDQVRGAKPTDFQNLGIKPIFLTSMTQGRGIHELLSELVQQIPKAHIQEGPDRLRVALLGRPNVGKSYLFNTLAKKQQAIVADKAGTTRDINRTVVKYMSREIELLDTAGIRRSGKIERGVERFSVIRSLSAIEQADISLVLMDVNELSVQLDQKIAGLIKEAGKGLIIVVTKWDTLDDTKTPYTRDQMAATIRHEFAFVPWAPLIFTSAVTGQNVTTIFDLVLEIEEASQKQISTSELNRWLRATVNAHPPAGLKNRNPKLNYIVQEADNPTNFKVYGSHAKFLHWSYKRYMERQLRAVFGFGGASIRFWFFDKSVDSKGPAIRKQRLANRSQPDPKS